jgi:hypothetical protein
MNTLDQAHLLSGIRAALGPGWRAESCNDDRSPPPESGPICFYQAEYKNALGVAILPPNSTTKAIEIAVYAPITSSLFPALNSREAKADGVTEVIARIEGAQHASLPSIQPGTGSGPITIQNDTSSTLTVYFAGTTNRKEAVLPHGQTVVSLEPGEYKVAGELSDKSVLPFLGLRSYRGGETERFYTGPK